MTDYEINQRIDLEHELVAFLFKTARAAGFIPIKVWDGEETIRGADRALIDAIFSVDESSAYFKHPDQDSAHVAFIVLGNDGYDAICDNSVGPGWDEVIAAVEDRFEPS